MRAIAYLCLLLLGAISGNDAKDGSHEIAKATRALAWCTLAVGALTAFVLFLQFFILSKTDETARITNRAAVYAKPPRWDPLIGGGAVAGWRISPQWENSGNTATRDLDIESWCPDSEQKSSDPWNLWPETLENLVNKYHLGPKQTGTGVLCNAPLAILDDIKAGKKHLYITSRAIYHDEFDDTYWHVSEYCSEALLLGDFAKPESGIQVTLAPCPNGHNCADKECEREEQNRPGSQSISKSSAARAAAIERSQKKPQVSSDGTSQHQSTK